MSTLWFILFFIFLVVEVATVGLVSIWFCFGSIFALIASFLTDNVIIQLLVFVVFSLISFLIFKPFLSKFKLVKKEATNYDKYIGKTGIVTKEITNDKFGEVKVDGSVWTAKSNKKIKVDEKIKVLDIEGVKLIVERVDD